MKHVSAVLFAGIAGCATTLHASAEAPNSGKRFFMPFAAGRIAPMA
jgi:hypothetical protein